jgi:hypothetical protein
VGLAQIELSGEELLERPGRLLDVEPERLSLLPNLVELASPDRG